MPTKLILVCVTILAFACGDSNEKEIQLFNGISFDLRDNEKQIAKTLEQQKSYSFQFEDGAFQCPLYQIIADSSNTYKIYLTIPVNTDIKDLYSFYRAASLKDSSMHIDSDSISYVYVSIKSDSTHKARLFKSFGASLMNINAVCNIPSVSDSILSLNGLSSRFRYDKNE